MSSSRPTTSAILSLVVFLCCAYLFWSAVTARHERDECRQQLDEMREARRP